MELLAATLSCVFLYPAMVDCPVWDLWTAQGNNDVYRVLDGLQYVVEVWCRSMQMCCNQLEQLSCAHATFATCTHMAAGFVVGVCNSHASHKSSVALFCPSEDRRSSDLATQTPYSQCPSGGDAIWQRAVKGNGAVCILSLLGGSCLQQL